MRHLNYNHLQYFWTVAREGSIVAAAEVLHLTPQTISSQLKLLDEAAGHELFTRDGRRLVLTEMGHLVLRYADEIFSLGAELSSVLQGRVADGPTVLNVGIVSSIPKIIAERLIAPALEDDDRLLVRCREALLDQLLGELAVHKLDLVLSDQSLPRGLSLKAYSHRLGASGLSFFAPRSQALRLKRHFPESLDEARILMPPQHSDLRRQIDDWLEAVSVSPRVVGEFNDSALMKAFGEAGVGVFPSPTVIETEVCRMYNMKVIGRTDQVTEQFFAISPERRLKHPSVVLIAETARSDVFPDD